MATVTKRKPKISFKDQLDKRRADLEELSIRTIQVSELRYILSQTIEDESSAFGSEQKRIPILTEDERIMLKARMLQLVDKFFK